MKTASVRDLRYNFPEVEQRLRAGETVEITKHGRVIARLSPPPRVGSGQLQVPDVLKRLHAIHGGKRLKVTGAEWLAQERERF